MKEYAILLDSTYCTGCNSCGYRCIQEFQYHDLATRGHFRTFVQVNDEGFMTNPVEWTKEIAVEIAREEGIATLTPAHWKVIDFCRQDAAEYFFVNVTHNSLPIVFTGFRDQNRAIRVGERHVDHTIEEGEEELE